MKYDARACQFNMDTGCVELLLRDAFYGVEELEESACIAWQLRAAEI